MNINQLRYFVAVGSHLNFSRAAEALHISQPSLSYQISDLEHDLGVKLFERNRRTVSLTPAGAALMEEAEELISRFDRLRSTVQNCGPEPVPVEFRVMFEPGVLVNTIARRHFVTSIRELRQQFPTADIQVASGSTEECLYRLNHDKADVIVTISPPPASHLNQVTIPAMQMLTVVPEDSGCRAEHEEDLIEYLKTHPLYVVGQDTRLMGQIATYFAARGVAPKLEIGNDPVVSLVSAELGLGAAVIPPTVCHTEGMSGVVIYQIADFSVAAHRVLQWKKDRMHPMVAPFVTRFIERLEADPLMGYPGNT